MRRLKGLMAGLALAACQNTATVNDARVVATLSNESWTPLFNGTDLTGWTPKFAHHPLGENVANIFRVEGGVLRVSYADFQGAWRDEFGHLFFREPFENYRLRLEYRLFGEGVQGAPEWTARNSGVMLHAQPPETMEFAQFFPISVETQFLAHGAAAAPTTANVCTPETSVVLRGERIEEHCVNSAAPALPMGEWVRAEVEVNGGHIRHFVNGVEVIAYDDPMTDVPQSWAPDRRLARGYIALQAEAHPVEFRNIEIMRINRAPD